MIGQQKEQASESKSVLLKVVWAVLVLAAIGGGYYLYSNLVPRGPEVGKEVPKVIPAESGSLVSGFPSELILEKGVTVKESYAVNYAGAGISQLTASYVSGQSMLKNLQMFKDYLSKNNWVISHDGDLASPITYFTADRGAENVNITLATDKTTKAITVTIAYVNAKK